MMREVSHVFSILDFTFLDGISCRFVVILVERRSFKLLMFCLSMEV